MVLNSIEFRSLNVINYTLIRFRSNLIKCSLLLKNSIQYNNYNLIDYD